MASRARTVAVFGTTIHRCQRAGFKLQAYRPRLGLPTSELTTKARTLRPGRFDSLRPVEGPAALALHFTTPDSPVIPSFLVRCRPPHNRLDLLYWIVSICHSSLFSRPLWPSQADIYTCAQANPLSAILTRTRKSTLVHDLLNVKS